MKNHWWDVPLALFIAAWFIAWPIATLTYRAQLNTQERTTKELTAELSKSQNDLWNSYEHFWDWQDAYNNATMNWFCNLQGYQKATKWPGPRPGLRDGAPEKYIMCANETVTVKSEIRQRFPPLPEPFKLLVGPTIYVDEENQPFSAKCEDGTHYPCRTTDECFEKCAETK